MAAKELDRQGEAKRRQSSTLKNYSSYVYQESMHSAMNGQQGQQESNLVEKLVEKTPTIKEMDQILLKSQIEPCLPHQSEHFMIPDITVGV